MRAHILFSIEHEKTIYLLCSPLRFGGQGHRMQTAVSSEKKTKKRPLDSRRRPLLAVSQNERSKVPVFPRQRGFIPESLILAFFSRVLGHKKRPQKVGRRTQIWAHKRKRCWHKQNPTIAVAPRLTLERNFHEKSAPVRLPVVRKCLVLSLCFCRRFGTWCFAGPVTAQRWRLWREVGARHRLCFDLV